VAASTRRRRSRRAAAAALLGIALATATAWAAPGEAELAAARQLFSDAVRDEDGGRWPEALEKLRRVGNVKLTSGIRYHIALCEVHLGRLASALDDFTAAQSQAQTDGAQDVQRLVTKQLADLGPRVPRLTIRVTPQPADLAVKIDDTVLAPGAVGTPVPVDPGVHRVEATASKRAPATATVTVQERDVTSIDLTLVETQTPSAPPAPSPQAPPVAPPPPAPAEASTPPGGGPSRTGAIVATAGAGALALVGVVAYVVAGASVTSGAQQCASERTTSPCDAQKNTVRAWDFTAAGSWIGAAGVGAIAIILWTRPAEPASAALLVGPMSLGVRGTF
jgi:hypothetical protein